MPETKSVLKIDFQNLGPIRLMPLDTATLFLPFGRPVADYIRENSRASRQPALDFPIPVAWQESLAALVRAAGVDARGPADWTEAKDVTEPEVQPDSPEPEPREATFLTFSLDEISPRDTGAHAKTLGAALPQSPVRLPGADAVPLRSRFNLAAAPQAKQKETPKEREAVKEPAASKAPQAVKAPSIPVAKPAAVLPAKAPAALPPIKAPSLAKPAVAPPALPRPTPPGDRIAEGRKEETPAKESLARESKEKDSAAKDAAKPAAKAAPIDESPAPAVLSRPPATKLPVASAPAAKPPVVSQSSVVAQPARPVPPPPVKPARPDVTARIEAKEEAPAAPPPAESKPQAPREDIAGPELHFGGAAGIGEIDEGFFARIPAAIKLGIPGLLALGAAGYFLMGPSSTKTQPAPATAVASNATGAQGWDTEWASDTVGSRRARQLQLYRPSMTLSDYRIEFTGTIESKALGWVFRATDTKNYYVMKIETVRPGSYQLTRFAVVDGRESSNSSKPLPVTVVGNAFQVRLDVQGPRFTAYVQGQPVDFWTDNRLKSGAVGFIHERDERAVTTSVRFSTQGTK